MPGEIYSDIAGEREGMRETQSSRNRAQNSCIINPGLHWDSSTSDTSTSEISLLSQYPGSLLDIA